MSARDGGGTGPTGRAARGRLLVPKGKDALRVSLASVERYDPRTAETVTEWTAEIAWWPEHYAPSADGRRASRRTTFAVGATAPDALDAAARLVRATWEALETDIAGTGAAGS